jgi:succinate dehydrogenase/fumarate reductase flavoprotein subunit
MSLSEAYSCDVLVIGSGVSGLSAAVTAALHGMQVVVAEKDDRTKINKVTVPLERL